MDDQTTKATVEGTEIQVLKPNPGLQSLADAIEGKPVADNAQTGESGGAPNTSSTTP